MQTADELKFQHTNLQRKGPHYMISLNEYRNVCAREMLVNIVLKIMLNDVEFVQQLCGKKSIFSGESHFHLSGFVNKQNCRI